MFVPREVEVVDPKDLLEKGCEASCGKALETYQACAARIEEKACLPSTPQYLIRAPIRTRKTAVVRFPSPVQNPPPPPLSGCAGQRRVLGVVRRLRPLRRLLRLQDPLQKASLGLCCRAERGSPLARRRRLSVPTHAPPRRALPTPLAVEAPGVGCGRVPRVGFAFCERR